MLDNNTITLTEAICLVIDSDHVNNFVVNMIREHIYKDNFEQHCYLDWLLNRWIHIRTHKYDLPRRTTELKKKRDYHINIKMVIGIVLIVVIIHLQNIIFVVDVVL